MVDYYLLLSRAVAGIPSSMPGAREALYERAVLSNLVSNVPAVLVLKPFLASTSDPRHAWLVVAMASTLAGNLTLVGSVANLIVAQRAARSGGRSCHRLLGLFQGRRAFDRAEHCIWSVVAGLGRRDEEKTECFDIAFLRL
jgi:hypothetical protein